MYYTQAKCFTIYAVIAAQKLLLPASSVTHTYEDINVEDLELYSRKFFGFGTKGMTPNFPITGDSHRHMHRPASRRGQLYKYVRLKTSAVRISVQTELLLPNDQLRAHNSDC